VIRRSFRRGLLLGVLGGVASLFVRMLRGRQPEPAPASSTWEPIPDTTPVTVPESRPAREAQPLAVEVTLAEERRRPEPLVNLLQEGPEPAKEPARMETPAAWIEPVDGGCPTSHPVKGKLTSKIFHVPGGLNYPRTRADRCYLDPAAAEADGLRPAKR
jgi:hypothetical protein